MHQAFSLTNAPIHSYCTLFFLLAQYSNLFPDSYSQNQSTSSVVNLLSDYLPTYKLPHTPFSNLIILRSFNMTKPIENTFINPSPSPLHTTTTQICAFSTLPYHCLTAEEQIKHEQYLMQHPHAIKLNYQHTCS